MGSEQSGSREPTIAEKILINVLLKTTTRWPVGLVLPDRNDEKRLE